MQLYPLRLRFLIAIGDVPLEAVTATNEAVDALIKNNAEDQEFRGSSEKRMPSSDAPHWQARVGRPDPSTEIKAGDMRRAAKKRGQGLEPVLQNVLKRARATPSMAPRADDGQRCTHDRGGQIIGGTPAKYS